MRARDQRGQRGDDQADRGRDRQPRVGGGLGRAAAGRRAHGPQRRRDRLGPRGARRARSSSRAPGTRVTVFERDEAAGGLVRFGVPEFKIEKWLVERRVEQLAAEGVEFVFGVDVGRRRRRRPSCASATTRSCSRPARACRATCRCRAASSTACTSRWSTSTHATRASQARRRAITAAGKHVVVIGGGDTGADCVGHAHREGAASVTQIELVGEPPASRPDDVTPWPLLADEAANLLRAEGGRRARLRDLDDGAHRRTAACEQIHWQQNSGVAAVRRSCRAPRRRGLRSSCCSRWASSARSAACSTQLGVERDARATSTRAALRDIGRRRVRRRRRAARPVADRVGDQRGPAVRRGRRRVARRCVDRRFHFDSGRPASRVTCAT